MPEQREATSAGAIVLAEIDNRIKMALAREPEHGDNAWVIPKGHVEAGETLEETALREVSEEIGLTKVQLIKYLGTIIRQSVEDSGEVVKKTIHLYLAFALDTVNEAINDESCTDIGWFEPKEAIKVVPFKEDAAFIAEQFKPMMGGAV
jgi:8-oxo-dGTP pyrophosphatase MutT (NUDIX family)